MLPMSHNRGMTAIPAPLPLPGMSKRSTQGHSYQSTSQDDTQAARLPGNELPEGRRRPGGRCHEVVEHAVRDDGGLEVLVLHHGTQTWDAPTARQPASARCRRTSGTGRGRGSGM